MKKRAQLPDAYTFTILFRGLSWHTHIARSPARALSIYQSMFAENSPVRPSIIHTNAVLKVCALAHDVDALLGIAAELPARGSGAPDNLSFTIILNAIRSNAVSEKNLRKATSGEEAGDQNERTALAVQQGRQLWVDIRRRWLSGDLLLDEEFVCAMGRLLLLGSEAQDQDDVLSLVEQTMNIPRQVGRLADAALVRTEEIPGANDDPDLTPSSPANVELETSQSIPREEEDFSKPPSNPFAPLPKAARSLQSAVRPSRNTISLILDACIRLKHVRAAQNYWGLLTSPDGYHKIVPDSENYHMYLRLLRLQRSSKLAVELVDEMRSGRLAGMAGTLQIKTLRIALSCCVRDINNRNSIIHAGKLVRMMMDALPHPDAKALSMYLAVALGQRPRDWRVIMGAIRDTELGVRNLRSLIAYDPTGAEQQNQVDVLKLVKELVGAIDVVLDLGNEEIKDQEKKRCIERRFTLAAYVTRMHTVHERRAANGYKFSNVDNDKKSTSFKQSRGGRRSSDYRKGHAEGESVGAKDHWMRLRLERRPRGPVRLGPGMAHGKRNENENR